jgi:hypothetical protein
MFTVEFRSLDPVACKLGWLIWDTYEGGSEEIERKLRFLQRYPGCEFRVV